MSIRYKLLFAFSTLLIILAIVVILAFNRLTVLQTEYNNLANEILPVIESLEHIKYAGLRIVSSVNEAGLILGFLEEEEEEEYLYMLNEEQELIAQGKLHLSKELQKFTLHMQFHINAHEKIDYVKDVKHASEELLKKSDALEEILLSQAASSEILEHKEELETAEQGFLKNVNTAIKHEQETIEKRQDAIAKNIRKSFISLLVGSIIVLLSVVGISYRLSYIIANPLIKLRDKTVQISMGEFEILEETKSRDEIGDLINSFSKMTRDLKTNIKVREQKEKEIIELNENLEHRVEERSRELKEAQKELIKKERLAALGQLTATISHEIRNPLGTIKNCLSFLQKYMQDDQPLVKDSVENAVVNIRRCNDIIADLLTFTSEQPLNPEPTGVDDWLNKLLDEYNLDPEIKLNRQLEGGAEIDINHERLRRVLVNVLDNACQAMTTQEGDVAGEKDKRLTVATRIVDGRLELSIHDTGQGIAPNDLEKIFELFYSTRTFGVGLGLPTAKKIMEEHSGGIEVTSEIDHGTRVILWLPLPAVG